MRRERREARERRLFRAQAALAECAATEKRLREELAVETLHLRQQAGNAASILLGRPSAWRGWLPSSVRGIVRLQKATEVTDLAERRLRALGLARCLGARQFETASLAAELAEAESACSASLSR
jgi:hypothetical protein